MIIQRLRSWFPPIGAWLAMSMHSSSNSRGTGRDKSSRFRTCLVVVRSRSALATSMAGTDEPYELLRDAAAASAGAVVDRHEAGSSPFGDEAGTFEEADRPT